MLERVKKALAEYPELLKKVNEDWFRPLPEMVIVGSGHVAQAVALYAHLTGFRITIFDEKQETLKEELFPEGTRLIKDKAENLGEYVSEGCYGVITLGRDGNSVLCMEAFLKKKPVYVGALCGKSVCEQVKNALRNDGFSEEEVNRLYMPIGVPIHAITPREIAISILAEVVEAKNTGDREVVIGRELLSCREKGVLCILTDFRGRSPRKPGSMMFVTEERIIDSIGGSETERGAAEMARHITKPCIETSAYGNREVTVLYIPMESSKTES